MKSTLGPEVDPTSNQLTGSKYKIIKKSRVGRTDREKHRKQKGETLVLKEVF